MSKAFTRQWPNRRRRVESWASWVACRYVGTLQQALGRKFTPEEKERVHGIMRKALMCKPPEGVIGPAAKRSWCEEDNDGRADS